MGNRETTCRVHRLVADVAILAAGRVLMVRYKDTSKYDHQKGWFLPDDFLDHLEHPADAARRIANEQVGIRLPGAELFDVESFGNGRWHLIFHYVAVFNRVPDLKAGDNVGHVEWFDLRDLPNATDVAHEGWALDVLQKVATPVTPL